MTEPELERAAEPSGPGFSDAVTFAWADAGSDVCGLVRFGLSPGPLGSALAVLYAGGVPVSALAEGAVELPEDADWADLTLGQLRSRVEEPLSRWSISGPMDDGFAIDLSFEAIGAPAESAMAGLRGYEHMCLVTGTVTVEGSERELRCLGQRSHEWGTSDWDRLELARTVTAWLEDGTGLTYASTRASGARSHAEETVACTLLGPEPVVTVAEPRLSTTYDAEGRQIRAGLELFLRDEDDYPHRGAGRAICGSTLELGQLRLDCSFFEWTLDGRSGVGRYDILRRTGGQGRAAG